MYTHTHTEDASTHQMLGSRVRGDEGSLKHIQVHSFVIYHGAYHGKSKINQYSFVVCFSNLPK